MPHALHLLDTDRIAGTERHVVLLLAELARQGAPGLLGCRHGSPLREAAERQGVRTLPVFGDIPVLETLRRLIRALRREKIDLVHGHNGRTMLIAAMLHRVTGVRVVATQHFLSPQHTYYRGGKRVAATLAHRWVNRQTAHFIAVSEAARQAMIAREGLAAQRITTVANGIAPPVCPPAAELLGMRRSLGLNDGDLLVVTLARLAPEKGLAYLLSAIPAVRAAVPGARFVVVGEGPQRAELWRMVEEARITDSVHFTGYREDATSILAAADLFVLPSLAEPAGLALLEAMSLEKPVIATRAGGPVEIVEDGVTGILVPPGEVEGLAQSIVALLKSLELRRQLGGRGRERYRARYTAEEMARATLSVYKDHCTLSAVKL